MVFSVDFIFKVSLQRGDFDYSICTHRCHFTLFIIQPHSPLLSPVLPDPLLLLPYFPLMFPLLFSSVFYSLPLKIAFSPLTVPFLPPNPTPLKSKAHRREDLWSLSPLMLNLLNCSDLQLFSSHFL